MKDIWKMNGDVDYDREYLSSANLPYKQNDPLYMKMIHRYRTCNFRPAQFYYQIDPTNQFKFIRARFDNISNDSKQLNGHLRHHIITFLAWISNMKGPYDIRDLVTRHKIEETLGVVGWTLLWNTTPITFFFKLSESAQEELIQEYNTKEMIFDNNPISTSLLSMFTGNQVEIERADATVSLGEFRQLLQQQIMDLESMDISQRIEASDSDSD